ncbi:hypothetical protein BMS3Bbin04_02109 [bacterium BMS3Bbin04]|nr:hypothetical protein BMS3Bbin04_02109 [bacterium BMS3Bbin04]
MDNYARDEAVKRADSLAHDGQLDLRRQEAVRQLVDGMAQSWRLQGDNIRGIVEDFYDELPPKPGYEFEKLAVRLFRRQVSASAGEVFNGYDPQNEHVVIKASSKYLDVPPNKTLDRSGFLQTCQIAYDTWTAKQAREAVEELLDCAALSGDDYSLGDLLPLLELRGARTWATALKLEQDIGVESASKDQLVRMLKRYALMVRRGGPEAIGLTAEPPIIEISPDLEIETETEEAVPASVEEFIDHHTDDDSDEEVVEETVDEVDENLDETEYESELVEEVDVPESEDDKDIQMETDDEPSSDVSSTIEFSEETEEDSDEDVEPEIEPETEPDQEPELSSAESEVEDAEEDDDGDVENAEDDVEEEATKPTSSFAQDEDEVETDAHHISDSEETTGDNMVRDPNRFHVRDLDELDDDDLEAIEYLFGNNAIQYEGDSEEDESEDDEEEAPIEAAGIVNGMQMRKSPVARPLRDSQGDPLIPGSRPHRDRFEMLRSGELRLNVVKDVYNNDETKFDIFLAKLSDSPDWKTGKTVIAKEMLDRHVNLEEEPARELFFALKKCMADVFE